MEALKDIKHVWLLRDFINDQAAITKERLTRLLNQQPLDLYQVLLYPYLGPIIRWTSTILFSKALSPRRLTWPNPRAFLDTSLSSDGCRLHKFSSITRPDMFYAVNKLSQFMPSPSQTHCASCCQKMAKVSEIKTIHHGPLSDADTDWCF